MNRRRLEFLFVCTLVVIALPGAIGGSKLTTRSENDITTASTEKQETKPNFSYVLKSVTTKPCILADMSITIKVPYKTKENKIDYVPLKVPKDNVTVDGHCSVVISHMKITWKDNGTKANDKKNSIKFTFINDHTNFSLFSIDLNIYRDEENFKNATDKNKWFKATSEIDLRLFVASVKNGIHKCKETEQKVGEAQVLMNDVSLIAFNRDDNLSSREGTECSKEEGKKKTFPYVSTNANHDICTMARMSISVTVPYKTKTSGTRIATIDVPTRVNVDGGCRGTAASMTLTWPVPSADSLADTSKKQNKIWFLLVKKEKTSEIYDIKVEIFTEEKHFADVERVGEPILIDTGFDASLFPAPVENGIHSCPNETKFTSTSGNITISDVLLVAFDDEKDFASKKVIDCRSVFFEDDFEYIIKENTGTPCTLAKMSITVDVQMKDKNITLKVPSNATATGICADKYSQMTLSWPIDKVMNNITFYVGQNKTHFFVFQIAASIYLGGKAINGTSYTGIDLFSAAATNGVYRCLNSNSEIELDDIRLTITDVTFVAFYTEQNIFSANVTECPKLDPITPETSTKPTPEPKPNVTDYNYSVTNSTSKVVCIAANMSISMEITYKTTDNKDEKGTLSVPIDATATGKCGDKLSTMELHWSAGSEKSNTTNTVAMNFEKGDSSYFIRSMNLSIYLDERNFPKHKNDTEQRYVEGLNEFSTPLNNVYKCARNTSVTAKDAKIVIANVTMIAFNTNANITSKSVDCVNDDDTSGSDAGAIVGGIIGGLIILVGIIFLVILYRRRRGY